MLIHLLALNVQILFVTYVTIKTKQSALNVNPPYLFIRVIVYNHALKDGI